jgi:hypothetical protein
MCSCDDFCKVHDTPVKISTPPPKKTQQIKKEPQYWNKQIKRKFKSKQKQQKTVTFITHRLIVHNISNLENSRISSSASRQ